MNIIDTIIHAYNVFIQSHLFPLHFLPSHFSPTYPLTIHLSLPNSFAPSYLFFFNILSSLTTTSNAWV